MLSAQTCPGAFGPSERRPGCASGCRPACGGGGELPRSPASLRSRAQRRGGRRPAPREAGESAPPRTQRRPGHRRRSVSRAAETRRGGGAHLARAPGAHARRGPPDSPGGRAGGGGTGPSAAAAGGVARAQVKPAPAYPGNFRRRESPREAASRSRRSPGAGLGGLPGPRPPARGAAGRAGSAADGGGPRRAGGR